MLTCGAAAYPLDARPLAGRAGGVTLIELMVTLTLLGVLVLLGLPSFVQWSRNAQVRTVAESLQTGLRLAQSEALRRNRSVILFFTNGDPASGVTRSTPASTATAVDNGRSWGVQTVPGFGDTSGQYITGGALTDVASKVAINTGSSAVCFDANGRLKAQATATTGVAGATCSVPTTTSTLRFEVSQAGADRPLRVTIGTGGGVRMCDPGRPALSSSTPDGCP